MAIEYSALFQCAVRQKTSDTELLRLGKIRNQALAALEIMRKNPGTNESRPESEWSFKSVVLGPEGPKETKVRIFDLLEEVSPLSELSSHCVNCPANVHSADFGCGGAIHYPISAKAESWLVSRLPEDLRSPAGQLLMRAINDFHYDGAGIDGCRGRKDLYESKIPMERRWGSFFSRKVKITSSQILHMAFNVGNLQPVHAKLIAYFTGFLNDSFQPTNDPENQPQPGDDETTIEIKLFFSTASLAGTNGVSVLIDA